jgi:hypothetical protein
MDVVIDEYLAMKRGAPGFALVEFGVPIPAAAESDQSNHLVADRLLTLLAGRLGLAAAGAAEPGPAGEEDTGAARSAAGPLAVAGSGPHGAVGRLVGKADSAADEHADDVDQLRVAFLIAVEAADALLRLAFRVDPDGDPVIVAETKELLRAYLARVLD